MLKASFHFFFIVVFSTFIFTVYAKKPDIPNTGTKCIIKLIGKDAYDSPKSEGKKDVKVVSESIKAKAEALKEFSIRCTGDNVPVKIHVLPEIKKVLEKKSEGVKLVSDKIEADGYLHFKDVKNVTIKNSVFENLEGGSLAPIVFDGCAIVLNNCSIKDNSMSRNGGMYVANSIIFIFNSVFSGNKAIHNGAMTADVNSQLGVYNTIFENNEGGLSIDSLSSFDSGAVFINKNTISVFEECKFINNKCQGNGGGALTALKRSLANFTDCIIKDNEGISGAISLTDTCGTVIEKSQIINNMAKFESSAITAIITSGVLLLDSVIKNNFGFSGAVLISDNCEIIAERCHFENNIGFVYGGALTSTRGGKLSIFKCTFLKNSGDFGGAIYQDFSIQTIIKESTFTKNLGSVGGGAIFQKDCKNTHILDSKFIGNVADLSPGGALMQIGCGKIDSVAEINQPKLDCDKNPNRKCDYIAIHHCKFKGNKVNGEKGTGSAIYQERCDSLDFDDTTFSKNQKNTVTLYQSQCIQREFNDVIGIKNIKINACPNEALKKNL